MLTTASNDHLKVLHGNIIEVKAQGNKSKMEEGNMRLSTIKSIQ